MTTADPAQSARSPSAKVGWVLRRASEDLASARRLPRTVVASFRTVGARKREMAGGRNAVMVLTVSREKELKISQDSNH